MGYSVGAFVPVETGNMESGSLSVDNEVPQDCVSTTYQMSIIPHYTATITCCALLRATHHTRGAPHSRSYWD